MVSVNIFATDTQIFDSAALEDVFEKYWCPWYYIHEWNIPEHNINQTRVFLTYNDTSI